MRGARYLRLIPWALQSGSEQSYTIISGTGIGIIILP
jgi:hypothetical protein